MNATTKFFPVKIEGHLPAAKAGLHYRLAEFSGEGSEVLGMGTGYFASLESAQRIADMINAHRRLGR